MRPWDETWTTAFDETGGYDCMTCASIVYLGEPKPDYAIATFDHEGKRCEYQRSPMQEARAMLAAASPDLYRALASLTELAEDVLQRWEGHPPEIGELETKRRLVAALDAMRKARGE